MGLIRINSINSICPDIDRLTMDLIISLKHLENAVLTNNQDVWRKFEELKGVFIHYANNEHQIMVSLENKKYSQEKNHLDDHNLIKNEFENVTKIEHIPSFLLFLELWLNEHISKFNKDFAEEIVLENRNISGKHKIPRNRDYFFIKYLFKRIKSLFY